MINLNRNTLSGLIAILLWSTTVGLARSISEQVGPLTAGASVYLTGGVLASVWVLLRKNIFREFKRTSIKYLFVCGSLFLIYTISLFLALGLAKDHYQTLEIGLINYLWPALTILIAIPIFKKRANFWLIPGTFIALTGVFFVIIKGEDFSVNIFIAHIQNNPVAYGIVLIAALSWALYSNLVRFISNPDNGSAVPFFILITGMMLFLLQFIFPEEGSFNAGIIVEISGLGIATALAYNLWENAMRKGDLILVVSVSYLTPFFSTVFTAFYLGILPGIYLWIGCLLIIAGSWLSWYSLNSRFVK
jgi:drug/metabolite transporter (DMT)-like permease